MALITGTRLVIASLATGNPRAGVRYVETELPNVLRFAAAAGLTVRVASLLAAAGASDEAMAVYEAHLSLWPHDPTAQNNLAYSAATPMLARAEPPKNAPPNTNMSTFTFPSVGSVDSAGLAASDCLDVRR